MKEEPYIGRDKLIQRDWRDLILMKCIRDKDGTQVIRGKEPGII